MAELSRSAKGNKEDLDEQRHFYLICIFNPFPKQFQEAEKKRYRAEQQRFETKHQRQLEEARASAQAAVKELEQMQNEKRKMLMEHETLKLKELDEAYSSEVREWKAQLKPRKQVGRKI